MGTRRVMCASRLAARGLGDKVNAVDYFTSIPGQFRPQTFGRNAVLYSWRHLPTVSTRSHSLHLDVSASLVRVISILTRGHVQLFLESEPNALSNVHVFGLY